MKIFLTRPIFGNGVQMLRDKGFEVTVNEAAMDRAATKEEMLQGVAGVDAILSDLTDMIDGEIMDAAGSQLKVIANYAVGHDNIDLAAAKERNIQVTNTPGVLTGSVAEFAFALMFAIARRTSEGDWYVREGNYQAWGPELLLGTDLDGKTIGIVGLGRIGKKVAHFARAFNMKIMYSDQKSNKDFEEECKAQFCTSLDDLLSMSDFVTLHVPLLDATRHLINEDKLKIMKKTAYLINTSRGPVIDEKALVQALKQGDIKGAALDVFEFEPKVTEDLKTMKNVVLTPHIASATEETRSKMSEMAANNIIAVLEGETPPNLVE